MHIDIFSGILAILISIMPSRFSSPFATPKTYTEVEAADIFTSREPEYECEVDAVSTITAPERVSKRAASHATLNGLERDFSHYAQELLYAIFAANKERNSSDPDVLMFMCRKLEQATFKLLEVSRKLIAAGGSVGCANAEELMN